MNLIQNDTWIRNGHSALVLAPMEGVTDFPFRKLVDGRFGFTHFVTEFLRVAGLVPPPHTITHRAPEILNNGRTNTGIPVFLQLLGGSPDRLALTAMKAVELGALGIDLNFGCPAPCVNRHDGGAILLKSPQRIFEIINQVRNTVPRHISVSAKLRLGWENPDDIFKNAEQAILGGANWLTIHGRTKTDGYHRKADWSRIQIVRKQSPVPIIANGDINSLQSFLECREQTGCEHFMIGRGFLKNPQLGTVIAKELGIKHLSEPTSWYRLFNEFNQCCEPYKVSDNYSLSRMKKWLRFTDQFSTEQVQELIQSNTVTEFLKNFPKDPLVGAPSTISSTI